MSVTSCPGYRSGKTRVFQPVARLPLLGAMARNIELRVISGGSVSSIRPAAQSSDTPSASHSAMMFQIDGPGRRPRKIRAISVDVIPVAMDRRLGFVPRRFARRQRRSPISRAGFVKSLVRCDIADHSCTDFPASGKKVRPGKRSPLDTSTTRRQKPLRVASGAGCTIQVSLQFRREQGWVLSFLRGRP